MLAELKKDITQRDEMNHQEYSAPTNGEGSLKSLPSLEDIKSLQEAMLPIRCDSPEAEHFFAPGMYGRRFSMPAGMLVVGKTHKHSHLMMVLKGRAEVVTEFGRDIVEAGYVSVSQPGAKRVVLALEDTVFMTVHHNPTDTEDLVLIEETHIEDEGLSPDCLKAAWRCLE